MSNGYSAFTKHLDVGWLQVDAVRQPDIRLEPAHPVQKIDGADAELAPAVFVLVEGLRQMGVQPNLHLAGQAGGFEHQLRSCRERGARGQPNSKHRAGCW